MALKVELKPGERVIIGDSVITNGDTRTTLLIDGTAPILREKDVLTLAEADTPAKRVYHLVQRMYLEKDLARFQADYFAHVDALVRAAPSMLPIVDSVNNWILTDNLYKALREAKSLIAHEEELLAHV
jgi:flagellar biosynthesis repressor protein FlbT